MRLLLMLLRTSQGNALTGMLASTLVGLAGSGFAWVLQHTIAQRGANWGWHVAGFIGCWLAYTGGAVLADNRITRVAQRAIREMRLRIARRLLDLPLPTLERDHTKLFPVLTEDIAMISDAAERLPSALSGFVTVLGCFAVMTLISWPLALACLVLLVVAGIAYLIPLQRFEVHLTRWRKDWDRVAVLIDALVRGHKELLLDEHKRRAFFERHLEPITHRQEHEMTRANTWETLLRRWGEMLLLLGLGALLFTIPCHGWASYEEFGRFLFVALFLLAPLSNVVGFWPKLSRVDLALERAQALGINLDQNDQTSPSLAAVTPAPHPAVRAFSLRAVEYQHTRSDNSQFTLGPISVAFDSPEIVFICGGNGSGKTTLLKLLSGLYAPARGEIVSEGQVITAADIQTHRRRFAAVFADSFLFPTLLGYESATGADALLKELQLEKVVNIDAQGAFSSTQLSQGQRKRLALVAALLEDKPVYVFDEWAADQDPEFRRIFYHSILPALRARGKLVIAITHDEAYFNCADRILHLVEGRLVDAPAADARDRARS